MSELQNPLFDEEKEFLERKKLEYERALRGDVDHIKDQSVMVGKVAAVGAGLAGGFWLITKVLGGKKRKKRRFEADHAEADDHEDHAEYFTAGNGKRYKSTAIRKSAADSASVFTEHHEQTHEADDLGFGSKAATPSEHMAGTPHHKSPTFGHESFEEDPFQDLPYDDSRRLPASHAFDGDGHNSQVSVSPRTPNMVGVVLQSFLKSDTGKVLVAQVAAVVLAMVTKKVGEFFPAAKNSDLAASPAYASDNAGASPAASSAPSALSDASNPPQSL